MKTTQAKRVQAGRLFINDAVLHPRLRESL